MHIILLLIGVGFLIYGGYLFIKALFIFIKYKVFGDYLIKKHSKKHGDYQGFEKNLEDLLK